MIWGYDHTDISMQRLHNYIIHVIYKSASLTKFVSSLNQFHLPNCAWRYMRQTIHKNIIVNNPTSANIYHIQLYIGVQNNILWSYLLACICVGHCFGVHLMFMKGTQYTATGIQYHTLYYICNYQFSFGSLIV